MSKQADRLFFWIIMAVILLAIASLSYFTFSSKTPTPSIATLQTKKEKLAPPKKMVQKPKQALKTKKEKKKPSSLNQSSSTKKKDQEKIPPKNDPPSPTPDTFPEINESVGNIDNLIEGLFQRINSRAQMQYGQILIDDFNLLDGGMHLEIKATNLWNLLHQTYKLQVLQVLANQYTLIACNVTRIVNCSPDNIPSINILDSTGREIASHNSSRGPQIFE